MTTLSALDRAYIEFLSNIGLYALGLTVLVVMFCVWLWNKQTDRAQLKERAALYRETYDGSCVYLNEIEEMIEQDKLYVPLAMELEFYRIEVERFRCYLAWVYYRCAQFQEFWAMAIFVAYMTVASLGVMYMYSLHPPCEARHDCAAVKAAGIYIGDEDE